MGSNHHRTSTTRNNLQTALGTVRPTESVRSQFRNFNFPFPDTKSRRLKQHRNPRRHFVGRRARHARRRDRRCRVAAGQNRADPGIRGHRLEDPRRNEYLPHRIARPICSPVNPATYICASTVMRICRSIKQHICASIMMRICLSIKIGNRALWCGSAAGGREVQPAIVAGLQA